MTAHQGHLAKTLARREFGQRHHLVTTGFFHHHFTRYQYVERAADIALVKYHLASLVRYVLCHGQGAHQAVMRHALEDLNLVGDLFNDGCIEVQSGGPHDDVGAHILGKNLDDCGINFHGGPSYTDRSVWQLQDAAGYSLGHLDAVHRGRQNATGVTGTFTGRVQAADIGALQVLPARNLQG